MSITVSSIWIKPEKIRKITDANLLSVQTSAFKSYFQAEIFNIIYAVEYTFVLIGAGPWPKDRL